MKFFTDGARCESCQLPRIDQAFEELGHKLVDNPKAADLVYINNPPFLNHLMNPDVGFKGKAIFNVLDLFIHLDSQEANKQRIELINIAKAINNAKNFALTTISQTVQSQFTALGVKSQVIYQPIMNVGWKNFTNKHPFKYLLIGRLRDPNKRISLGVQALQALNIDQQLVAVVGSEHIVWGRYLGMVSEQLLNELYNSVNFVICPSKEEGILLPMIEAIACRTIPVVCNDLSTRQEFLPSATFSEYDECYPNGISLAQFISNHQDPEVMERMKQRLYLEWISDLADKFTPISVAKRIISTYNKM